MIYQDLLLLLRWWLLLFIIGIIFLPTTLYYFKNFYDKGYIFSKIIGIAVISYAVFFLGLLRILPFTPYSILFIIVVCATVNFSVLKRIIPKTYSLRNILVFIFEELLFLGGLLLWSFIRAHEPSLRSLEKFMDFGFINSILRSEYFPPKDMWFPPLPINYYYFGHLVTAVLTKISLIPSSISYNLMLATIFSFTFTCSFSLGSNFFIQSSKKIRLMGGILSAFLMSFSGNLHTLYSFFKPYNVDKPLPLWQLSYSPVTFPNSYWYANATRYIPFTIHEFPLYSFVVADLHGHVTDIPFVLFTIALCYSLFLNKSVSRAFLILLSFFVSVMYMTNAWDGIIYALLISLLIAYLYKPQSLFSFSDFISKNLYYKSIRDIGTLFLGIILFSLPFSLNFKPFVSGIGILCAPQFLIKLQKIGPFLFEADRCQRSPLWQLLMLYGFFYFFVVVFIFFLSKKILTHIRSSNQKREEFRSPHVLNSDIFIIILIILSSLLIIIPEFIYVKDIYPNHYRANTMFKLVYQSFIMLSFSCAYIIVRIINSTSFKKKGDTIITKIRRKIITLITFLSVIAFFLPIFLYPYFAIPSYYDLKTYRGLDGSFYLKNENSGDYEAIKWIKKYIKGQPVILEAQGDSYTDYGRISVNTGIPTVLGWTVHEWLWRGSYDIPAPRIEDIKNIYESNDLRITQKLLKKYSVSYVYIGRLEREKYPNLIEDKFKNIGKILYRNQQTVLYKIN